MTTHYPDGDKPKRIMTIYRCPLCNGQISVKHTKGESLEDQVRIHRANCRARRETTGGIVCRHLGIATKQTVTFGGCGGGVRGLFKCKVHGHCLPFVSASQIDRLRVRYANQNNEKLTDPDTLHYCAKCEQYDPIPLIETPQAQQQMKLAAAEIMINQAVGQEQPRIPDSKPSGIVRSDD